MAINKKLIHFGTRANFDKELAAGNILDTSIVFIKDAKLIWTHGQYYGYDSVSGDLKDRLDNIEEIIEENEFVTAKALTELEETKANISDTLEGYGITDAYTKEEIDNKNFYVKPDSGITKDDLSDSIRISLENADNYKGTVTGVKINNETAKNPTSGIVNLEISKSTVGLGNVDNTADANKNVKSAISAEKDSNGNIISETYAKSASLKAVATSGSYNDLTDKPESLKNPESLTIQANGTTINTYDGSSAKTINITASNLGLSSALKYCGITTTTLTDGSSTNPVKINNTDHTATQGCVVFYGDKEFIFNGSVWEEFGYPIDLSSYATTDWVDTNYKPKQTSVSSPTASGNTTAFIDTISQNANGVISVTKKNVDFSNYLKKTDATGANVSLSTSYVPAVFPEDTGDGEFTALTSGEKLDSAIKKLDQNIANLVQEVLDNEEVYTAALTEINDIKANFSDTLEGYGITNAYTKSEVDDKFYVKPSGGITEDDLSTSVKNSLTNADTYKGTVTGVKINGTTKNPSNGIVDLGTITVDTSNLVEKTQLKTINSTQLWSTSGGNIEISKSTLGLGNVDNTSDANKNVKSAVSAEKDSLGNVISSTYAKASDLKTVATSGSYNDLSNTPTALKNPEELIIKVNGTEVTSYDGSIEKDINITSESLGLTSALKYCGITTTALTDGSSTNPVKINNTNHTATTGCVVFYGDKEFIFNGSVWEEFGYPVDMSSYATTTWVNSNYKPKQTAVNSPTASGNTTAFIDTISQNANGVISVTKKNIDLSQYLKKSDTDSSDISLPSDFEASTYPENTGNGVFTELVPGESLSSAIQTLDKNLVEIVEETLKNEKVTAQGLSELSTVKANVSDLSAVAFSGSYNDLIDIPEIDLKISDNFSTTEYGGNIEFNSITKGDSFDTAFNKVESNISDLADKLADNEQVISASLVDLDGRVSKKQDTLVSGTNIKTINGEDILGGGDITIKGGGSSNIRGLLNIRDITSLEAVWNSLTENGETATYIITDPEGNYPSPNIETVYIDSDDLWLDLFYRANGDALKFLIKEPEAYYQVLGNAWSSQTISNYIRLPKPHLQTAKVGDLVTIARQEFTAQEFYSKYIDYNSINFRESLPILEKEAFNLWLSSKGISTSLSDGKIIEQMIIKGLVYSCLTDPEVTGDTPIPLSINEKVVLYTAHITPNTQNIYSGEFWTGNMTGAGIYSYVNAGVPDNDIYTGYVSPDGTQTLISIKDPGKIFTRSEIGANWKKITLGGGYNTKYSYGINLDECLTTGVCAYTPAEIMGINENWTLFVDCTSDTDGDGNTGYYHLTQTAISRTGSVIGKIFKRFGYYQKNGDSIVNLEFLDWSRIDNDYESEEYYHCELDLDTDTLIHVNENLPSTAFVGRSYLYKNGAEVGECISFKDFRNGYPILYLMTQDYTYIFIYYEDEDSSWWDLNMKNPMYSEKYATKDDLSGKQNTISDLETIRQGAALGKTALQHVPSNYATKDDLATAIANAITTTLNTPV